MRRIRNILMKKIFLIIGILFLMPLIASYVNAVECGAIPIDGCFVSQSTTFNTGTYSLPNGIEIDANNIILDCNGSVLSGTDSINKGITIRGHSDNVVTNCNVKNYSIGIYIIFQSGFQCQPNPSSSNIIKNSVFDNNSIGVQFDGSLCTQRQHKLNQLTNNTFKNNLKGIELFDGTDFTNISQNNFVDNFQSGVHVGNFVFNNSIYNNTFNQTGITYDSTGYTKYCLDGNLNNSYLDGANGPGCNCLPLVNSLRVNTNENICRDNYNLSNGIRLEGNGVTFDCNNSVINGIGSGRGISIEGDYDNNVVRSCNIANYYDGIILISAGTPDPDYNTIIENNFENNTNGIRLRFDTLYNTITKNMIKDNANGILLETTNPNLAPEFNNIWNNNLINNTLQASVAYINNSWNFSFNGGNYWSNFDEFSEGCDDSNNDLICDVPYNISGSAGNKDYLPFRVRDGWLLGPQIGEIIPIQVVNDVDLVKGKTTLIRIPITFTSLESNDTITPQIDLYWNGSLVDSNLTTDFNHGEAKDIDFWYVPSDAETNVEIRVEVNGMSGNGIGYFDENSKSVGVVETRELELAFITVDGPLNNGLTLTIDLTTDFVQRTYPLEDGGINYEDLGEMNSLVDPLVCGSSEISAYTCLKIVHLQLLGRVFISGTSYPERIVGTVPSNWFINNFNINAGGNADPGLRSVLIEESYRSVLAHELGHTYGFCEEYSSSRWESQNKSFDNGCQNGDVNPVDGQLDASCLDGSTGCDTSTIGKLLPWNASETEINLFNFMGLISDQNNRWVSKDSYEHLLDEFSHSTPQFVDSRIYISGLFNDTSGDYELSNFYALEEGLAENLTDYLDGEFMIDLRDNGNNSVYNLSFDLVTGFNEENETISNISAFGFVIPFNENITDILFFDNGLVKKSVSVSNNAPNVEINYPNGGEFFTSEIINVSWNASDLDGDDLSYAILLSADNGGNYTTLIFDHNHTSYVIDSSNLPDCDECLIKILATDSVNTNLSVSGNFAMDNNLNITDLSVVFQNNTERIFKFGINNTLNSTLNNVTWELDTGEEIINSQIDISLSATEESSIFVYYNYTSAGNYDVIATARSDTFIEVENISIVV